MDIIGLPLHPLIVHAAVVFIPLAALGGLLITFSARLRARYGWLTAAFGLVAAVSALVARISGEALINEMGGGTPAAQAHHTWGVMAPIPAIVLAIALPILLVVDPNRTTRRTSAASGTGRVTGGQPGAAYWVAAAITVASAIASLVLIVLTGHSGATAVWGG